MICQKCSKDIPEDSGFCPFCGAEVIAEPSSMFCKSCGNSIPADSEFCPFCGTATSLATGRIIGNNLKRSEGNKNHKRKIPIVIALCVVILLLAGLGIYKMTTSNRIDTSAQSVLYLELYDSDNNVIGSATGVPIDSLSILTNYKAIDEVYMITAYDCNGVKQSDIKAVDSYNEKLDLVLLHCEQTLSVKPLKICDINRLDSNDKVGIIGYTLGGAIALSDSSITDTCTDDDATNILRLSSISEYAGNVVVSKNGQLVGIAAAEHKFGDMCYTIPVKTYLDGGLQSNKAPCNLADLCIHCYSVDYVLEHYQELTNQEFYIDGWVSLHSYRDDDPLYKDDPKYIVAWAVLFNGKEDIPHTQDADKSDYPGISIDEELHDQYLNVIVYTQVPEAQKVVKTMKTGYHVKALGRIKTEYLAYGGVSMDVTHIDIQ